MHDMMKTGVLGANKVPGGPGQAWAPRAVRKPDAQAGVQGEAEGFTVWVALRERSLWVPQYPFPLPKGRFQRTRLLYGRLGSSCLPECDHLSSALLWENVLCGHTGSNVCRRFGAGQGNTPNLCPDKCQDGRSTGSPITTIKPRVSN